MNDIGLESFFAVTATSLYLIRALERNRSSATKLLSRKTSNITISTDLADGGMISVGSSLQACMPDLDPSRSHGVWVFRSSPIVALFFDQASAVACLEVGSATGYDDRWAESSRAVLRSLLPAHVSFIVYWDRIPAHVKPSAVGNTSWRR
jgi:hypothetical protein